MLARGGRLEAGYGKNDSQRIKRMKRKGAGGDRACRRGDAFHLVIASDVGRRQTSVAISAFQGRDCHGSLIRLRRDE